MMDAQVWHDYCTAERPHEPRPLTVRQLNAMTDQQREAHRTRLSSWLADLFVHTDELSAITNSMTTTVQANSYKPPGAKHVPALTGPNYVGKSTVMMRWARRRYIEWTAHTEHDEYSRPITRRSPNALIGGQVYAAQMTTTELTAG